MYSCVIEKAPFSNLMIEHANVTGKCKMESSSSSGNVGLTTISEPPASTVTTHTTVSLRSEDVQAIVTGLAANPTALAAVALMMQSDQQPGATPVILDPSTTTNWGTLEVFTTSPHRQVTHFSSLMRVKVMRRLRDRGSRVHRLGGKISGG